MSHNRSKYKEEVFSVEKNSTTSIFSIDVGIEQKQHLNVYLVRNLEIGCDFFQKKSKLIEIFR